MQSLVRPIARRSFLATGGSGAVPMRAHHPAHVEPERLHLVQPGLEDPGGDLDAAREARRRRDHERELRRLEPRLLGHPRGHLVGRKRAPLEHQHAVVCASPRSRASRTAPAPPARARGAVPIPWRRTCPPRSAHPAYWDAMQETAGWSVQTGTPGLRLRRRSEPDVSSRCPARPCRSPPARARPRSRRPPPRRHR